MLIEHKDSIICKVCHKVARHFRILTPRQVVYTFYDFCLIFFTTDDIETNSLDKFFDELTANDTRKLFCFSKLLILFSVNFKTKFFQIPVRSMSGYPATGYQHLRDLVT